MERAIAVVEKPCYREMIDTISEVSRVVAEKAHEHLPDTKYPENYVQKQDFSNSPVRILVAESREPKRDFTIRLTKLGSKLISDKHCYFSVDPSAATREAWAYFGRDLYDINHMPSKIDLAIEKCKTEQKENATFKQNMDISQVPFIASMIKPSQNFVLVGGLEEKEILAQSANVINVDYIKTGKEDVVADIEEGVPLPSDSFDHVGIFNLFEILYNPRRAYSEAYRLLKPGGNLWIIEPYVMCSQGYGIFMEFSNESTVYEELRLRGLLYYPDRYESMAIGFPLIRHAMRLGGFSKTPLEFKKENIMVVEK